MDDTRQEEDRGHVVDAARGRRLRAARERAGTTQQVAAAELGITRQTLRRWEQGYWMPSEAFEPLAALYRVRVAELRDGLPDEPSPGPARTLPDWPQWARERWAELYVELVKRGATDEEVAFLRGLVLSPLTAAHLDVLDDAAIARDVHAGSIAARAWLEARRSFTPPAQAAS